MDEIILKKGADGQPGAGTGDGQPGAGTEGGSAVVNKPSFDDNTEVDLGEGKKITFKELKSGYFRQDDYTRKTQELADQRKGLEADTEILTWLKDPEIPAADKIKALAEEWKVPYQVAKEAVEEIDETDPNAKEFKTLRQEIQGLKRELEARDGITSEKEVSQEISQVREKYKDLSDDEMRDILDIASSPMNTKNKVSIVAIADRYFGRLKERDTLTIKNYLEGKTKDKEKTPPPLGGGSPAGDGGKKLSLDDGSAKRSFIQRMKDGLAESSGA